MAPPRHTDPSSARPRPTPTSAEGFSLAGPSAAPDPDFNAYRKDLADVALAGTVIASHYAEPLVRQIGAVTALLRSPNGEVIRELHAGEAFALLDDSLGWAWGYAGTDRRVGYIAATALSPSGND